MRIAILLTCLHLVWMPHLVRAQSSRAEIRSQVSLLFDQGLDAADAGRWDQAVDAFEQAYELMPRPTILFNLAGAWAKVGLLRDAEEAYRQLAAEADPAIAGEARAALPRLTARIPKVSFEFRGMADGDEVELDDAPFENPKGTLRLDPGKHRIAVVRDGRRLLSQSFSLDEGDKRQLVVYLPGDGREGGRLSVEGEDSVWSSPWLWATVGVLVAGSVTAVILAQPTNTVQGAEPPFQGSISPGSVRLD